MCVFWSNFDSKHRTLNPLLFIIICFILLSVNPQSVTFANAISSNSECEEQVYYDIDGVLHVKFSFTNVISLPITTSDFVDETSFMSLSVWGSNFPYDPYFAQSIVTLSTNIANVSQGKSKADALMAKFEKLLNIAPKYYYNTTSANWIKYWYRVTKNEPSVIQRFIDTFLEHKPSDGFCKIITPTLLENYVTISFSLEKENSNLTWETNVDIYCPDYIKGWSIDEEQTISLREMANYSGTINASLYSRKSTFRISFHTPHYFFPTEEVIVLETIPSQMKISKDPYHTICYKEITGSSVEDLYICFKFVRTPVMSAIMWLLIGIVAVVIGLIIWLLLPSIKNGLRYIKSKEHFSVLLTREYGIQLIAVLFTCLLLYQLRKHLISLFLDGIASILSIITWLDVGIPPYQVSYLFLWAFL